MSKSVELYDLSVQQPMEVLPSFDYGNITDEHKSVVVEIVGLLKSMGQEELAGILNSRFKIVEPKRFKIADSQFVQACTANQIYCAVQGHVQSGTDLDSMHYPLVTMSEDIRKFERLFEYIKNLK
jgi:hypothetical protein